VALIVIDDPDVRSAEQLADQVAHTLRAEWFDGPMKEPLLLPRVWPNVVEAWLSTAWFALDAAATAPSGPPAVPT
jgi:hypothetical protein